MMKAIVQHGYGAPEDVLTLAEVDTTGGIFNGSARYDLVFQLGGTYSPAAIRKVLTPVVARAYPLSEAPQAIQLVERGRPAGKVTVTITRDQ